MNSVYRQSLDQLGGWRETEGFRLAWHDRWWRIRSSYAPYLLFSVVVVAIGLLMLWTWHDILFGVNMPWIADGIKIVGSVLGLVVLIFALGHNYRIGSARTARTYMELSRDPLSPLIERYSDLINDVGRPVAVFIDDLDLCDGEYLVELLQTIQTLFRKAKVLYVVAADRDWVCASYEQVYAEFSDTIGEPGKSLGHLFLEKIFQLSVEVPRLDKSQRDMYWDGLINKKRRHPPGGKEEEESSVEIAVEFEGADTEAQVVKIIERYRDDPFRAEIAAAKGFQRMHSAPLVQEREHFLSDYQDLVESNPRAMKRLLNAYGFRRGFDIQARGGNDPDALVRWTILENRWPILADYLEGRSSGRDESGNIESLKKNPAVQKVVEGLTWERLRLVASAPYHAPISEITPVDEPEE